MVSVQKRPEHSAVAGRQAPGSTGKAFSLVGAVGVFLLVWHFFLYLEQVPNPTDPLPEEVQGIVILTGDKHRLETGFSLLTPQRRIFVSGVYPGVRVLDMPWPEENRRHAYAEQPNQTTVTLGHAAYNTRENALESALWIEQNQFKAIALVTSDYHMPRSLAEFKRAVPLVQIYAVPVVHERGVIWYYYAFRESVGVLISVLCAFLEGL